MHYDFVRIHQTLRVTPAMAARETDMLWELSDMVQMLEQWEARTISSASIQPVDPQSVPE
jgi:hypothetical protein